MAVLLKKTKYEASAIIQAFHFQIQRALYRLFSATSATSLIGVETIDDVSEVIDNNKIIWEQNKFSSQENSYPFQDSSINLWHTIRIWIEESDKLKCDYPEMSFLLVTNKNVPTVSLVNKLSDASSDEELNIIIDLMKKILDKTESIKLKENLNSIFSFSNEQIKFVLKNTTLYKNNDESEILIKEKIIQLFQLPSSVLADSDTIYQSLLGELMDSCDSCWSEKRPAWFKPQQFKDRLWKEIQKRELEKYIDRDLFSTEFKKYLQENSNDHLFIKQLAFLSLTADEIDDQLNYYWGFYSERIRLMDEGDVLEDDWQKREKELLERWKICRRNARIECRNNPEILGKKVFITTLDATYKGMLGSYNIQNLYFTHGQYHFLANDPMHDCYIYWHDNFKKENLIKNDEE